MTTTREIYRNPASGAERTVIDLRDDPTQPGVYQIRAYQGMARFYTAHDTLTEAQAMLDKIDAECVADAREQCATHPDPDGEPIEDWHVDGEITRIDRCDAIGYGVTDVDAALS